MGERSTWMWGVLCTALVAGCVVQTETVPGPPGDKGEPGEQGPPGDAVWREGEGFIYYEGGNVGIGKPVPEHQLDIRGVAYFDRDTGGGASVEFEKTPKDRMLTFTNTSGQSDGGFQFYASDSQFDGPLLTMENRGVLTVGRSVPGDPHDYVLEVLRHGTPGSPGPYMQNNNPALSVVDYADIGPASYVARDAIVQFVAGRIVDGDPGAQNAVVLSVANDEAPALTVTAQRHVGIRIDEVNFPNGPEVPLDINGDMRLNGIAQKTDGGGWTMMSDERLKKNISPLNDALSRLLALKGVHYEWIDPGKHGNRGGPQIGMIAQQVEKVFPDWVGITKDGHRTITIHGFEALVVESFREVVRDQARLTVQVAQAREDMSAVRAESERTKKDLADVRSQLVAERAERERLQARLAALEERLDAFARSERTRERTPGETFRGAPVRR